jgi:CBS domain-containing protein
LLMIKHIMIEDIVTANPNTSLKEAIDMLYKKHVGSLMITDANNRCVGIFTERDLIRVVARNVDLDSPIEKVMTSNVVTIGEEASIEEARRLIVIYRVRHLPVVNGKGELVGLFSVRKLLDDFFGLRSSKYC